MSSSTSNISSQSVAHKVCCFGELLLRMSPELNGKWIEDASIPFYIGGAELNVATALANWDVPVKYCTAVPNNYLSEEICASLNKKNIDTSAILFQGDRIGMYFLPQGADLKHAGVIYDRAGSSFWDLRPGMIDWDLVLSDCTWFHWSAISPALNANTAALCAEAVKAARKKGLTISVDLNYRSKLWQYGVAPKEIMLPLLTDCDVVMGNIWAVESLLGIASPIKDSNGKSVEELIAAAENNIASLKEVFKNIKHIAYTFRLAENYFAVLHQDKTTTVSNVYKINEVVDKVGSGDCFMAALIYALLSELPSNDIINRAAVAAIGKMQEKGDATKQAMSAIESKMKLI
jgi:2-dehydro-3-deoxygluconokinase